MYVVHLFNMTCMYLIWYVNCLFIVLFAYLFTSSYCKESKASFIFLCDNVLVMK